MASFRAWNVSLLVALLLGTLPAAASGSDPKADAARIFQELMSPFCPGLTLADCPSEQAFVLRDEISARLAAGDPADAVVSDLVAKYGVSILADPSTTPVGAIIWGTPILVAALAALGLALFVRRAVKRPRLDADERQVISPELDRLLDEQLHALD
ncbi:MAG: cytochrome c-type biogenesis protein CcmH [Vicinamibacterales bacterium]